MEAGHRRLTTLLLLLAVAIGGEAAAQRPSAAEKDCDREEGEVSQELLRHSVLNVSPVHRLPRLKRFQQVQ